METRYNKLKMFLTEYLQEEGSERFWQWLEDKAVDKALSEFENEAADVIVKRVTALDQDDLIDTL